MLKVINTTIRLDLNISDSKTKFTHPIPAPNSNTFFPFREGNRLNISAWSSEWIIAALLSSIILSMEGAKFCQYFCINTRVSKIKNEYKFYFLLLI